MKEGLHLPNSEPHLNCHLDEAVGINMEYYDHLLKRDLIQRSDDFHRMRFLSRLSMLHIDDHPVTPSE